MPSRIAISLNHCRSSIDSCDIVEALRKLDVKAELTSVALTELLGRHQRIPQQLGYTWEAGGSQVFKVVDIVGQEFMIPGELCRTLQDAMDVLKIRFRGLPTAKTVSSATCWLWGPRYINDALVPSSWPELVSSQPPSQTKTGNRIYHFACPSSIFELAFPSICICISILRFATCASSFAAVSCFSWASLESVQRANAASKVAMVLAGSVCLLLWRGLVGLVGLVILLDFDILLLRSGEFDGECCARMDRRVGEKKPKGKERYM